MKKTIFALTTAAMLILGGTAFAGGYGHGHGHGHHGPQPGDYSADVELNFSAIGTDTDSATSNWGWGNDTAEAGGWGGMTGTMNLTANGKYSADVDGGFIGFGKTTADAKAWDFGLSSGSIASVKTVGFAAGMGTAEGYKGLKETATGSLTFTGAMGQATYAAELGYANGGISAGQGGNLSWTDTEAMNQYSRCSTATVYGAHGGMAEMVGGSFVNIDPYGAHRGFEGTAFTKAVAPGVVDVNFSGGTGGYVSNGPSGVSATANYAVDTAHANSTYGAANINADMYSTGSFTGIKVTGSASAGSNYNR